MAFKKDGNFTYHVGDIDETVDSRGNTVLLLRKLAWGNGQEKLEIRKWFIDINKETPSKGVTFLTDEGPGNLINALIDNGYGNTKDILSNLSKREDFDSALAAIGKRIPEGEASDEYFDPKTLCESLGDDE